MTKTDNFLYCKYLRMQFWTGPEICEISGLSHFELSSRKSEGRETVPFNLPPGNLVEYSFDHEISFATAGDCHIIATALDKRGRVSKEA